MLRVHVTVGRWLIHRMSMFFARSTAGGNKLRDLRSGKKGRGGVAASRKHAIAIGLSEARKKGTKVPRKKPS